MSAATAGWKAAMDSGAAVVSPAIERSPVKSAPEVVKAGYEGGEPAEPDTPSTPEEAPHTPAGRGHEAEPVHAVSPAEEVSAEGPSTPRQATDPAAAAPEQAAPFGSRDCAAGPMAMGAWFAHAAEMVQGHAKAADASGKVAEQAEAARASAENHVAEAKAETAKFANETRDKAERAVAESREKAEKALTEARENAERAMTETREKAERAVAETREKAEAMAKEAREKAEAFANDAKEKAEAFANEAKEKAEAFANETKEKAAKIWAAMCESAARFEGQVQALIKRGMAALPAPPARTAGEPDDDLLEWKRCRRCQAQFDASAEPKEGTCRYHPAKFECGVGEGDAFTRRHLFGAVKCDDACEGRFPCCGARQRLCAASSSGCRSFDKHCCDP